MPVNEPLIEPVVEPAGESAPALSESESTHRLTPAGVPQAVRVRAGRYGELDTHELVQLLDTIDSEAQRARFRESIYISVFVWIVVAWFLFYGPRFLWHQPKLLSPTDVMRQRELTQINDPALHLPPAPRLPPAKTAIDNKTMEHLKTEAARRPTPKPAQPMPEAPTPPQPAVAETKPPPPLTPVPQPRAPLANVPDAPAVAPTKPAFTTAPSASSAMKDALNAPRPGYTSSGGGSSSRRNSPANFGGVEMLSPNPENVDFDAYIRRMKADLLRNWIPLLPEETQPPLSKQGITIIRVVILPDGTIGPMYLDGSTHDLAINKAAWGAFTSEGQFPPLPKEYHGKNLELRWYFYVNKGLNDQ